MNFAWDLHISKYKALLSTEETKSTHIFLSYLKLITQQNRPFMGPTENAGNLNSIDLFWI